MRGFTNLILIICILSLYSCDQSIKNNEIKGQISSADESPQLMIQKINLAYEKWVDRHVESGQSWHEEKWKSNNAKWQEGDMSETNEYMANCLDGLPDKFSEHCYGDINKDGILDCVCSVFPLYCMSGTALRFANIDLFFISDSKGNYLILEDPEEITSRIGIAGGVDKITKDGIIVYNALDYQGDEPNCCPSKKWSVKFKYDNGKFKKIK